VWRPSLPVDDERLLAVREIDDDRNLTAETEVGDLADGGGERGGDAGVHRVAAAGEHAHAGLGGEVAAGGHDADATEHFGAVGRRGHDSVGGGRDRGGEKQHEQHSNGQRAAEIRHAICRQYMRASPPG